METVNNLPNVEPSWMSLKRLVETRMGEIVRKERGNKKYIRLYGAGEYWHAFEESAFLLDRLFKNREIVLFSHKNRPFPVVMACIPDNELQVYTQRHIPVCDEPGYKELLVQELSVMEYRSWHERTIKEFM